ncbi:hypothetical protein GCM10009100_04150 [Thalassospira tepidiphila]
MRVKAHGLTVNGYDLSKIKVTRQISEMEEIGHRGSPNVKICLFLTQQTAHRTAKVEGFTLKFFPKRKQQTHF